MLKGVNFLTIKTEEQQPQQEVMKPANVSKQTKQLGEGLKPLTDLSTEDFNVAYKQSLSDTYVTLKVARFFSFYTFANSLAEMGDEDTYPTLIKLGYDLMYFKTR